MTTKKNFGRKIFWPPKWSKLGHFLPKKPFFSVFGLYLPNGVINFHNFCYGNYPCGFLWENHSVYAEKNSEMAKIWPFVAKIWPFFGQNWLFWVFWPITQLWIFLIFGLELLWISTLSGKPIILCLADVILTQKSFCDSLGGF